MRRNQDITVGVVGAGHMGSGLGAALREGGARVVTSVAGRSARTVRFAESAGLQTLPTLAEVIEAADVVLVVTPPGQARAAARAISATGRSALVADLNATSPSTVDDLAGIYGAAGLSFVDGSISGPPPSVRPGARIYLSGPDAATVVELPWRHVQPVHLGGRVGTASALKMCTASVYKGLDGLVAQALRAAAHYGVLDEVVADLRTAGLGDPRRVAVAATKAHRFVPEMREIAAAQQAAGLTPALFTAFAEVYGDMARSPLGAADPESVRRTLAPHEVVTGITPPPEVESALG
jgi:3-hydroxyisobutyrate dehydrogenase-like beta-hydroxyacid dehydrogenase